MTKQSMLRRTVWYITEIIIVPIWIFPFAGVAAESVENLRNESQGKYHACEKCMGGRIPASVYITDYGDRYHSTLACSGLKRTVYAIPLSEAVGKGACSKCGK